MRRVLITICFLITTFGSLGSDAAAQMPVTVQGSLRDGAAPANGSYDIRTNFYTVETGGVFLAAQIFPGVQVTNGVFTVAVTNAGILFSAPLNEVWIEYEVRPAGGPGPYTTLAPRRRVSYAPFAISAVSADYLGGTAHTEYVQTNDPRMSDARTPLPGSSSYIANTISPQSANFNISGTGTAGTLDATQYKLGNIRTMHNGGFLDNIFVGVFAGEASTTGTANAFFGTAAGQLNTSGLGNSFFGWFTGRENTTGNDNSFFGGAAGGSTTSGANNAFFGRLTGSGNTIGNNNSAVGFRALFSNTIGTDNVSVGVMAGNASTTGNRNTFVGASAGISNTTESNNTALGNQADVAPGVTNATAIGNQARAGQSNSLILGSINGVNGATADTNVGIGTATPASRLHVNGTVRVTNGAVFITNPNTVIITSPNGACWGITVNNSGGLATFPVSPCP